MDLEGFTKERLWLVLVETVHKTVMYPNHKSYTRDVILRERPDINPIDLAHQLNMSFGEALVIMEELRQEMKTPT